MSSRNSFQSPRVARGAVVRWLRLVSAQPVFGTQKNSKWSFVSMFSSSRSRTWSTRSGISIALRLNAFTQRSVTVEMIPSAPSPTRAALKMSGSLSAEHSTIDPSPAIKRRPVTCVAMPPRARPVPCVAVEMAPDMDW